MERCKQELMILKPAGHVYDGNAQRPADVLIDADWLALMGQQACLLMQIH